MKKKNDTEHVWIGPLLRLVGMIFCICAIIGIPLAAAAYSAWHTEKIFSGVLLASHPVGGKSKEYSEDILREYNDRLQSDGAVFRYDKKVVLLYPQSIPFGSDSPVDTQSPLLGLEGEQTLQALTAVGRSGSIIEQQGDRFTTAVFSKTLSPIVIIDADQLTAALKKEFSFFHSPAHNASFTFDARGKIIIKPESSGIEFDYERAIRDLKDAITALASPSITLVQKIVLPEITIHDLEPTRKQAEQMLAQAPLTLVLAKDSEQSSPDKKTGGWSIPRDEIMTWLLPIRTADEGVKLTLDSEKIRAYLTEHIAPSVFIPIQRPRFKMKDGKVIEFELAKNGRSLDDEKTAQAIIRSIIHLTQTPTTIAIKVEKSPPFDESENNFAITDLLNHSETSFAGSPTNRRKNITRGSALINGLLVAPGEAFSLVKALGTIDRIHGFFPELVIKENKTIPEFGGGLCQVSTTLFRAVARAGLEVLERRNHSYRVSYYEPPVGFDATIYDPAPDFRFKNDTPQHILIQSSVKGNSMIVELWGTNDGRRIEIDKPTVYNIKKAGKTKIIETSDLPPGEKKCTERAHDGADAFFERRIFYTGGAIKKETYKSHYVVWPAVCMVGKALDVPTEATSEIPQSEDSIPSTPLQKNTSPDTATP